MILGLQNQLLQHLYLNNRSTISDKIGSKEEVTVNLSIRKYQVIYY